MNRIHDMPPGVIEDLDERYPVGVLGQDAGGWGYITIWFVDWCPLESTKSSTEYNWSIILIFILNELEYNSVSLSTTDKSRCTWSVVLSYYMKKPY